MGGFVAHLVDEGHEVYRVAVTDSARGTFDRRMTIAKMKEAEVERKPIPGYRARRRVVERTHSSMNRLRRLLIRCEKKVSNYLCSVPALCVCLDRL
jgi:hypothetical protein